MTNLQQKLKDLGFDPNGVDGHFGPGTTKALIAFQLASAAFFFNSNNIWAMCDKGADDATVTRVTKAVNGGNTGLAERLKNFKEFMRALS